jgi:hypothetical protein
MSGWTARRTGSARQTPRLPSPDIGPSRRSLGSRPIQSKRLTITHPRPDEPGACSSEPRMGKREEPTMHTSSLRRMQRRRRGAVLALPALVATTVGLTACGPSATGPANPAPAKAAPKPTIVLVHGAWPMLQLERGGRPPAARRVRRAGHRQPRAWPDQRCRGQPQREGPGLRRPGVENRPNPE